MRWARLTSSRRISRPSISTDGWSVVTGSSGSAPLGLPARVTTRRKLGLRSLRIRSLVIAVAVVVVANGCTAGDGPATHNDEAREPGSGEPAASEPHGATFVAVDYSYPEAPAQLAGGVIDVRFENRGTVGHELAFAGIGDASIQRWVEDLGDNALSAFPVPDYLDQVATPPFVSVEAGARLWPR